MITTVGKPAKHLSSCIAIQHALSSQASPHHAPLQSYQLISTCGDYSLGLHQVLYGYREVIPGHNCCFFSPALTLLCPRKTRPGTIIQGSVPKMWVQVLMIASIISDWRRAALQGPARRACRTSKRESNRTSMMPRVSGWRLAACLAA